MVNGFCVGERKKGTHDYLDKLDRQTVVELAS